jgi:hypothetical protein
MLSSRTLDSQATSGTPWNEPSETGTPAAAVKTHFNGW